MLAQEYRHDPKTGENVLVREYDDGQPEPPADPQATRIAELEATVAALKDQATGKITKAQLTARLAALPSAPMAQVE